MEKMNLPKEGFDQLDLLVSKLMTQFNGVGMNIALISNSKIADIKSYGYFDKENHVLMYKNAVFQIASISKPITAWGIMKLVEQGKINLDMPVMKYLKRWTLPKEYETYILKKYCPNIPHPEELINHDEVTVRRLLSHTAGLSLSGYSGSSPDDPLPTLEESLKGNTIGRGDVRVIYPPGSKYEYSGGGYTILQLLIEEITGRPFTEYIENTVLKPLGMNNSSFTWREDIRKNTPKAYGDLAELLPIYRYTTLAAAGCYSTVEDLAKFAIATMKGPNGETPGRSVLKLETIELMLTKVMTAPPEMGIPNNIGLGYFIMDFQGLKVIQHSGGNTGWRSMMIFIPQFQTGLIVLTNSHTGLKVLQALLMKWSEHLLKNLPH